MAMKKKAVERNSSANDDTIIYKVMVALGVLCIAVLCLNLIGRFYGRVDMIGPMQLGLGLAAIVLGVAAFAQLAFALVRGKQHPLLKALCFPLLVVLLLFAGSFALLHFYWTAPLPFLYFLFIAATILYIIYLLYQMEFVLLSFVNVCAGAVFYLLSHLYGDGAFPLRAVILDVLLVLVLGLVAYLAFAAREDGKWKLGKKTMRIFHPQFSPIPLYLTSIIWLVCLVASFFLGSLFAYYCIFAVAAWELIFAVYYTFKLT